jgi:hypothetical protein
MHAPGRRSLDLRLQNREEMIVAQVLSDKEEALTDAKQH